MEGTNVWTGSERYLMLRMWFEKDLGVTLPAFLLSFISVLLCSLSKAPEVSSGT